jgi:hypothetical protein
MSSHFEILFSLPHIDLQKGMCLFIISSSGSGIGFMCDKVTRSLWLGAARNLGFIWLVSDG